MTLKTSKLLSFVIAAVCTGIYLIFFDSGSPVASDGTVEAYGNTRVLKMMAVGVPIYLISLFAMLHLYARDED